MEKRSRSFRLRPFTPAPLMEKLSISGSLNRTAGSLLIEYNIRGALQNIKRPEAQTSPCRCHELWRRTCFEVFFGIKGNPGYWELNYSLSGCWNVYRFDDYRLGMCEDLRVGQPLGKVQEGSDYLTLNCKLPLNGIVDDSSELEAAACLVIEASDGSTHYWAIEHQTPKPDFHNRPGFLIALPGREN